MTNFDENALSSLNQSEKDIVLEILKEVSTNGSSKKYAELLLSDYEEVPISITEFLHNSHYLGKGLIDEEGRYTVFPYWEDILVKLFPDPIAPAVYNTVALTGAIGLGKSFEAVLICLYELYRMLCLKDPYLYYGLQPIDKITFALMNITLDAAQGVAWDKLQQLVQSSEWFMKHGTVSKGLNPTWKPIKKIELICGSQSRHILGRAVFFSFFDEISFQPNQDIGKQKEKAKNLVNTAVTRMQSRFMKGEKNPTILVLASSKRTEQSFMETFIQSKKQKESKTTLVIDEPQWVIRTDKDSPNKFKVAVGSKFLPSEVLPLNATKQDVVNYRDRGYKIIDVPMGYYETFIDDIDIALTDIAGISTVSSNRYFLGPRITEIESDEYQNAFTKEIIEVGNGPNDIAEYSDFFDISRIPVELRHKPLYIHLDMSLSGDKTGIGGVFQSGKKITKEGNPSNDLFFTIGFNVSVKAPKGYQVSFEKNRNFIRWLKENGFRVKGVSSDTYQSADLLQVLKAEKFNTDVISVDRVTDKICQPYQYFRNTMYEKRLKCYKSVLLKEELIGLERDNNTGKIDHSPSGINCFTGDTKVSLVDGRELTFIELLEEYKQGKTNYVYSLNLNNNLLEPKPIHSVWCSGKNAKLIEVELDNGEIIKCTPEHKFMLRSGEYIEAQYLKENDSLMPLYRKYPDKGLSDYRMYYDPLSNHWYYEHRRFAQNVYDQKYLVHHINCNPKDNTLTNLIWMSKTAHTLEHVKLQTGAQSTEAKEALKTYNESKKGVPRSDEDRQKMSVAQKNYAKSHPYTKERLKKLSQNSSNSRWYNNGDVEKFIRIGNTIPEGFVEGRINHKVVSVRKLDYTADVYDMEIEDNHNFALSAGIFVHNSKDSADAICGALWNASQHAEEYAFEYGDDIENITTVSGQSEEVEKEQITVNFEEELKNAFAILHKDDDKNTSEQSKQIDFGLGPSVPFTNNYINEGIILW